MNARTRSLVALLLVVDAVAGCGAGPSTIPATGAAPPAGRRQRMP
jgi:predicted small lipoprotein YifL